MSITFQQLESGEESLFYYQTMKKKEKIKETKTETIVCSIICNIWGNVWSSAKLFCLLNGQRTIYSLFPASRQGKMWPQIEWIPVRSGPCPTLYHKFEHDRKFMSQDWSVNTSKVMLQHVCFLNQHAQMGPLLVWTSITKENLTFFDYQDLWSHLFLLVEHISARKLTYFLS